MRRREGGTRRHNRVAAVLAHVPRYSFKRLQRLSTDAKVSKAALSRILRGASEPCYQTLVRIADAIGSHLGIRLDLRELVSKTGEYPTRFVCDLTRCKGCLPGFVFDEHGRVKPRYRNLKAGMWTGDTMEQKGPLWEAVEEIEE